MQKHRSLWKWLLGIVIVIIVGAGSTMIYRAQAAKKYIDSSTPTFFFHGWGSSYHAEQHMANAAKRAGATNTIIWANVAHDGAVTFHGNIPKGARNPIIEVNLADNKQMSYHRNGHYAYDVIHTATQRWHFKKMNLVGHSMGNLDIIYYLLEDGQNKNLPKLVHHVAIAGHFNGGIGFGYPKGAKLKANAEPTKRETHFTEETKLRSTYPKGVKVLNIYGNLQDGTNSDSQVPVDSAKTLRYLVGNRAGSYQEHEITGSRAQHSKLHRNPQVDRLLINFLWGKKDN